MFRCRLCGWDWYLDDVAILLRRDTCVCLACFSRAVGDTRTVSAALIRAVTLPEETLLNAKLPPDVRLSERPM